MGGYNSSSRRHIDPARVHRRVAHRQGGCVLELRQTGLGATSRRCPSRCGALDENGVAREVFVRNLSKCTSVAATGARGGDREEGSSGREFRNKIAHCSGKNEWTVTFGSCERKMADADHHDGCKLSDSQYCPMRLLRFYGHTVGLGACGSFCTGLIS